ncbi:uncharacterized protein [Magallana gigas]|uniref:uncharacterized protein n=1 Tax=Magallana gigas TaxID=29159 RepID=UPI0033423F55
MRIGKLRNTASITSRPHRSALIRTNSSVTQSKEPFRTTMKFILCLAALVCMVSADRFVLDLSQDSSIMKSGDTCYFWRLNSHEIESVQSPTGIYELETKLRHLVSVHTKFGDVADLSIYSQEVQTLCAGATLKSYSHH